MCFYITFSASPLFHCILLTIVYNNILILYYTLKSFKMLINISLLISTYFFLYIVFFPKKLQNQLNISQKSHLDFYWNIYMNQYFHNIECSNYQHSLVQYLLKSFLHHQ